MTSSDVEALTLLLREAEKDLAYTTGPGRKYADQQLSDAQYLVRLNDERVVRMKARITALRAALGVSE